MGGCHPERSRGVTEGLEIREETLQGSCIGSANHNSAVQALLALALLLQQVAAAVALHGNLAGASLSDSLLCAAV